MKRIEILKTYKIYIGGQFPRTESGRFYPLQNKSGDIIANMCLSSRKDLRNAVTAARSAFGGWSGKTAYNRSQILYRIAKKSLMVCNCPLELMAPISVFLSKGFPTFNDFIRCFNLRITSSCTLS